MNARDGIDAGRVKTALSAAVGTVFADMAFIDATCSPAMTVGESGSPSPLAGAEMEDLDVRAAIDILKPLSCSLELRMPRTLSDTIKETLGAGDEAGTPDGPPTDDAVLEMVNVLAGTFLSEYFGPGAPIKLELPQYLYEELGEGLSGGGGAGGSVPGTPPAGEPLAMLHCDAEGRPFEAYIHSVRYRY